MKVIIFIIGLVFIFNGSTAQNFQQVEAAFAESYQFEKNENLENAIRELENVYSENSYEINLRMGLLNYLTGNYIESSGYYKKAIGLKPFSVEARLGIVYPEAALGNWTFVKAQYFNILEIDEMNTLVNYRLGLMFYNEEDYTTAMRFFEKVVNQYPFDYDGTIMYAWTHLKTGKLRQAEVLFQKALLIKPGDESAREGLELVK
nr:tetratricopeptide repeat protein [Bacteroidota bacterium]